MKLRKVSKYKTHDMKWQSCEQIESWYVSAIVSVVMISKTTYYIVVITDSAIRSLSDRLASQSPQ